MREVEPNPGAGFATDAAMKQYCPSTSTPLTLRNFLLLALALALGTFAYTRSQLAEGCEVYIPVDQPLIAHAGGGLSDRFYANNREAIDLAVSHGFELIELDFLVRDGQLLIGHDDRRISDVTLADLRDWLASNPQVSIVTDVKSGNSHLPSLAAALGKERLIPQIYHPSEFAEVRSLGFERVIFTAYRMGRDDWQDEVNALDLLAVTVPEERKHLAEDVRHPVYLHTVNQPLPGYGLYTDCLIPA